MTCRTRFAPSPTGPLHLGHAYSAMLAFRRARHGAFLLRIEDIDRGRCRPYWESLIFEDLRWLGLDWPEPVLRQSDRLSMYREALHDLWERGLLFACRCNRRDIAEAAGAPQGDGLPPAGPDGIVYPGTCRRAGAGGPGKPIPADAALRLDMSRALSIAPEIAFDESGSDPNGQSGRVRWHTAKMLDRIGDVVLARRDMGTSYHLSVVIDDAAQGITEVVRGQDLFEATAIHVLLQRLLGLPTPLYHHHRLIRDEAGKRLAKRDDARSVCSYRDAGASPAEIRAMVGL